MGAVGGAVASVVVFWALFLMGFAYMHRTAFYRRFDIQWAWPQWPALREILRLGVPMSLSYALEATSFTAITLLAARLGTTVMGGHQVVANLAALCFMLPLSLSVATATLTAQAIGAGDPRRARETALTGLRIGALVAAVTVLAVWTFRRGIVRLYSGDPAVAAMALTLIPYLAAFHFFDALQTVASFVLRAYRLAIAPTVIHAVALWGLGVGGGYLVAFGGLWGPPWGITGMWLMQSLALGLAALLLVGSTSASRRHEDVDVLVASARRALRDRVGQGQHAAGVVDVQVLDQAAVEHDDGVAPSGGVGVGRDHPARPVHVAAVGAKTSLAIGDLLGVDQRLAVEAEVGGLTAGRREAGLVVEVQVDAVQRGDPGGARGEHAELEAGQEREALGRGARVEILRQVGGAHDQRGDARARGGDRGRVQDSAGRLQHAPHRLGRAQGGDRRGHGLRGLDLGQEHRVRRRRPPPRPGRRAPRACRAALTRMTSSRRP